MNRREFTGRLATAALYPVMGKASAGLLPGNVSELSMTELQQQFLDLRFGMYIHLNMATYELRMLRLRCLIRKVSTPISGLMLPARQGWRMGA
jgi:hypothetical protein